MSIEKRTDSPLSELSAFQLQKLVLYFCVENLRLKRTSTGKEFGYTFMQKGIARLQEEGIPHLNYLFTLDRLACEFSPDLQSDYNKLRKALQTIGYAENQVVFKQTKEVLESIFGSDLLIRIERVADSLKEVEVRDLISQSDKKDEEEVRRSRLFYLNPESSRILGLKELDVEAETKEIWISSLRKNTPLPTASPASVSSGKLSGLVKLTGFLIPIDYLFEPQGKTVALFCDSRRDLNQSCICLLNQDVTIQALVEHEEMLPEGKFLVIGKVVPNSYCDRFPIQTNLNATKARFALEALAILQVVVGYHTVITSVDKCVEEIKYYAKKDSYQAFMKSSEIKSRGKKWKPMTVLTKIRDFCKVKIRDGEIYPKEQVQSPSVTLNSEQADCKAKVCLVYAMLMHESFVEKLDLVFLDTEGTRKPNHVQIEATIRGVSSPIALELTENLSAFRRETHRFALPLYAN